MVSFFIFISLRGCFGGGGGVTEQTAGSVCVHGNTSTFRKFQTPDGSCLHLTNSALPDDMSYANDRVVLAKEGAVLQGVTGENE